MSRVPLSPATHYLKLKLFCWFTFNRQENLTFSIGSQELTKKKCKNNRVNIFLVGFSTTNRKIHSFSVCLYYTDKRFNFSEVQDLTHIANVGWAAPAFPPAQRRLVVPADT